MTRALGAVVAIVAACGQQQHESGVQRDLKTTSSKVTGLPGPQVATFEEATSSLVVTGVSGAVAEATRARLASAELVKRGAVAVAIHGVLATPGRDGTLQLSIQTTAVFAHPPQVSKLTSTIAGRFEYHGLDAKALGAELGDIVIQWLEREKVPAGAGVTAGPVPPAQRVAVGTPSCSVHADGSVRCWDRDRGAVPVPAVKGTTAIDAATNFGACGIRGDGRAYCIDAWDNTTAFEARDVCGVERATAISVGQQTACAVVTGGRIRCWGRDARSFEPCQDGRAAVEVKGVTGAETVESGPFRGCARTADGTVACWEHCGKDCKSGVVGRVDVAPGASVLKPISKPAVLVVDHDVCGATGERVTCVGDASAKPTTVVLPAAVTQLAHTPKMLCALVATGDVLCWTHRGKPHPITASGDVVALDGDLGGGCAVTAPGEVVCWGGSDQSDVAPPSPVAMPL